MEFIQFPPLVSVIIPCYNQGAFLADAIESVMLQNYANIEIIVIDDGSNDLTNVVARRFGGVRYFFQNNQGLSAARNRGVRESKGAFIVFLDADDLLFKDAILYNLKLMLQHEMVAFVSGAHDIINRQKKILSDKCVAVASNHYLNLLKGNYIGMHATVMYRRKVFDQFQFDTTLKACEDYDLYLKVASQNNILHHGKKLAAYRMHDANMSGNSELMLETSVEVLQRQKLVIKNEEEVKALEEGLNFYKNYYAAHLFSELKSKKSAATKKKINALKSVRTDLYLRVLANQFFFKNRRMKTYIPEFVLRFFYQLGWYKGYTPAVGDVKFGDLKRTIPFSKSFGFDRGGAIDRYYIENFLKEQSNRIRGYVLEIGDNHYTLRFGKERVIKSDVLHVNSSNINASIIGDLSNAPQIPDESFDCIILTQTLHLVYDFKSVIKTCYRILKPGGALLLTVPGISPIDYGEWGEDWFWSFNERVIVKILSEFFDPGSLTADSFGNVNVATAFLYGLGLPEISKQFLDQTDAHFPVIITATALKEMR